MIMELVVDTNILLAALLKPSMTQNLIFSKKIELFAPEHCLGEIQKYSSEFAKRMGKSEAEFALAVSLIFTEVKIIPGEGYEQFKEQSESILTDKDDWPFIALALGKKCPIWSNDKGFKKQTAVTVYSTSELIMVLK